MILQTKTKVPVKTRNVNFPKQTVYAELTDTNINEKSRTYTFHFKEWWEEEIKVEAPNEETGEMETKSRIKKHPLPTEIKPETMSFQEVSQMKQQISANVQAPPNLEGEDLDAFVRSIGHLFLNNQNQVRGVEWEIKEQ